MVLEYGRGDSGWHWAVGVMHPSLVQLLRYRYVEPSAEPIPLQRFDEGDKTGEEHRKHCPLAACGSKPDPSLTNESPTYARGVVKMEPGTEKDLNNDTKVFNADIKEAQKNPSRTTLTYAQRCLLTWEASRLLSSQSTPARRRQTVEDDLKPGWNQRGRPCHTDTMTTGRKDSWTDTLKCCRNYSQDSVGSHSLFLLYFYCSTFLGMWFRTLYGL
uniref:Uncharacterized protein TCIL3000_9_550 n=1 Tax=Trypanosoma congolense (strain IL3000) TaxID=1068625 RepID=G0UTE7_TRYCI|nr:unnamed protein product [Trypanosoma congolense IL3000]